MHIVVFTHLHTCRMDEEHYTNYTCAVIHLAGVCAFVYSNNDNKPHFPIPHFHTRRPDNWQHYVEYIHAVIQLAGVNGGTGAGEDPVVEAAEFLADVRRKAVENHSKDRGPLLGPLQLAKALKEAGMEDRIPTLCGRC